MRKMNISFAKSYIDKNTNATKTKWVNIGSLVIGDDGKVFGEIESIPVGATELKFNCFDKEDRNQPSQNNQQPYNGNHNVPTVHVDKYGNPIPNQQQQKQQYQQQR